MKAKKQWYLLKVDGELKNDVSVLVTPKKLLTKEQVIDIVHEFDGEQNMSKGPDRTPSVCKKCCQFSKGVCLVLSVNVSKYGKPAECTK